MAYLSPDELARMGFKSLGKNLKISSNASLYDMDRICIGDNSRIDDFCVVSGRVEIGRNVHIAALCTIAGGTEGITFGDFAGVAYGSAIFSQSDDYTGRAMSNPTIPARFTRVTRKAVHIGRHCLLGAGSMVMPGVALAEGTSVGAMSMVNKSTDPWSIYFGIPAKRIRARDKDLLALEKDYLASEL